MFAFSAENERILVMKYGEKSCKLIITSVAKTDEGIWRGVVTLAFRRNALQHHNYNVSIFKYRRNREMSRKRQDDFPKTHVKIEQHSVPPIHLTNPSMSLG